MIKKNMFDDLRSPEEKLSIKTRKFVNDINSSAELSKDYRKYGISTQGRIIPLEELKKRVAELKAEHVRLGIQPTQEFSHLIDIVENGIKVPKFRFFGDRKYKKVQKLFTPDYTIKLYTGEIASCFESEEDFNDADKWRQYVDRKEEEYKRLRETNRYTGSFEEYLLEPASTIFSMQYDKKKADTDNSDSFRNIAKVTDGIIAEDRKKREAFYQSDLYKSVATYDLRTALKRMEEEEKRKKIKEQIKEEVAMAKRKEEEDEPSGDGR